MKCVRAGLSLQVRAPAGVVSRCDFAACCPHTPLSLQTLALAPGYWRYSSNATVIRKCNNVFSCNGGTFLDSDANSQCASGYAGPLCSLCAANFTVLQSTSGVLQCVPCSTLGRKLSLSSAGLLVVVVAAAVAAVFLGTAALAYLAKSQLGRLKAILTPLTMAQSPSRENVKIKLKLLMPFLQATQFFKSELEVLYPKIATTFLERLSFVRLTLLSLFKIGCGLGRLTQLVRLLILTFVPLALVGLVWCLPAVHWLCARSKFGKSKRLAISVSLSIAYFMYMPVTLEVFRSLSCDAVGLGQSFLRADYSVVCSSDSREFLQLRAFAVTCLVGA